MICFLICIKYLYYIFVYVPMFYCIKIRNAKCTVLYWYKVWSMKKSESPPQKKNINKINCQDFTLCECVASLYYPQ
jgi:hypothetical protein